jgi:5'/3'-nucleotidase SurE
MKTYSPILFVVVLILTVFALPTTAQASDTPEPLNILLCNDDGFDSLGIQMMRAALLEAGHQVLVVAPKENQSGKGASVKDADWVEVLEQSPGVWSVDNTPVTAVRVGLNLLMANNPPDLIISGLNFGQNLGQIGSVSSGTVCAALMGLYKNVPAIACSVGINISEYNATPYPFISTIMAFEPAAAFMVRLVEQLQATSDGGKMLPDRTMLNICFPVPYPDINGVKITRLGEYTFGDAQFYDLHNVIPNGGGLVMVYPTFFQTPDPVFNSDFNAHEAGFISISILDGDMTAATPRFNSLKHRLFHLRLN